MTENSEANTDPRLANLRPWKPGQSGNPGGRPKKKPLTELYEELLADPKVMADLRKVLARTLKSGEVQLLREMADRVEGKVTQSIEHSGRVSLESLIVAANKDEPSDT